jgi:hypothetical protein
LPRSVLAAHAVAVGVDLGARDDGNVRLAEFVARDARLEVGRVAFAFGLERFGAPPLALPGRLSAALPSPPRSSSRASFRARRGPGPSACLGALATRCASTLRSGRGRVRCGGRRGGLRRRGGRGLFGGGGTVAVSGLLPVVVGRRRGDDKADKEQNDPNGDNPPRWMA